MLSLLPFVVISERGNSRPHFLKYDSRTFLRSAIIISQQQGWKGVPSIDNVIMRVAVISLVIIVFMLMIITDDNDNNRNDDNENNDIDNVLIVII